MASTGKPSRIGKKGYLKNKPALTTEVASSSADPLSSANSGAVPIATTDLQGDTLDANQGNDIGVDESLMNEHTNGIHGYASPVQPVAKKALRTSLIVEDAKDGKQYEEQRWTPSGHPRFKPCDQLKSWRDLKRCDENESFGLSAMRDTIRGSSEHSTLVSSPFPSAHGTGVVQSQISRTIVNQLPGTPQNEDSVSISIFSAPRVPEWRRRVPSIVPAMGKTIGRSDRGAIQIIAPVTEFVSTQDNLAYELRGRAMPSGKRTMLGLDEPPNNGVMGSPLPPMGNFTYTPRQARPSTGNFQQTGNNENMRITGPRTPPNRTETARGQPAYGANPSRLPFNPGVIQTVSTPPNTRPMGHHLSRLFPFPEYNGEETTQARTTATSIPSTVRVTNELSTRSTNRNNQIEFEITGYHRSDPTVLWADEMPPAIVPPSERHAASHLLGAGLLAALSSDSPSNEISFVKLNAPSSLPPKLLAYLEEKKERIRRHAEGDVWRAQHMAEIVRRHEKHFFARKAEKGDWGLKGWHTSREYHGQPSGAKGRGSAFGGRGGRGDGWGGQGGRGRGRGGFEGPVGMGSGILKV